MATGIRIDNGSVVIPLELLDSPEEGLAVLTLARGAFLVMRTEMLDALPRQRLLDFGQAVQGLKDSRSVASRSALTAWADPVLAELWDNEKDAAYDNL
jgi:hypothetical protein